MELSEAAQAALRSGSDRIGAKRQNLTFSTKAELLNAGLIGANAGLTIKGSIEAERLARALERELFG
jgi:hypothetical protein